jgi:pilus assembly protein CpaC
VTTQTGRPAFFLSGGRQAVLGPASGINGPGVTFQQVGVSLEVLPIVYGNGQIWLEINPTNRQVNQGFGITTVFGATPGFTEQQTRCAVMLESGQTFAIGGLIQNSVQASSSRVPLLGDLPFIGTAFSRVSYNEAESELVILVTPRLVHQLDCNQVPKRLPGRETRSPDDYELFLEGILEAPRGQRKVWNGKCYNAAYKCDPTIGTYPCVGNVCYGPNGTALPAGAVGCGPDGCAPRATLGVPTPGSAMPVPVTPAPVPLAPTAAPAPGTDAPPMALPIRTPASEAALPIPPQGPEPLVIPPVDTPVGQSK